ncbi:UNVERIFIED_CONTAM: hypothetical protein GTU68_002045 [Idotea baltica]|nr:hypothetical protein [Idotea baltica]
MTNNDELADKLKCIVNHGQREKYISEYIGINSRLDSLQAVVLNTKLKYLNNYIEGRNNAADFYDKAFTNKTEVKIPQRVEYSNHVFHQYTLNVGDKRNLIKEKLAKKGIPTMIYYPYPLHLHPAFKHLDYKEGNLPISERLAKEVISLPMHSELNEEQLTYISNEFKAVINSIN